MKLPFSLLSDKCTFIIFFVATIFRIEPFQRYFLKHVNSLQMFGALNVNLSNFYHFSVVKCIFFQNIYFCEISDLSLISGKTIATKTENFFDIKHTYYWLAKNVNFMYYATFFIFHQNVRNFVTASFTKITFNLNYIQNIFK